MFDSWIAQTRKLQEEAYGMDYSQFTGAGDTSTAALVEYISWNTKAAVHELVELDGETSWKPWQHDEPYVNRHEVVKEAVDVLHFVANVLAAVGVTDQQLTEVYLEKMGVNRRRQLEGYKVLDPGVKCRVCKRALDDVVPDIDDATVCAACATELKKWGEADGG
jgi:dUTPase